MTLYSVSAVAEMMGCSNDTARQRMRQMTGVMNVGTARRHQLMVTAEALEDWLRNHRIMTEPRPLRVTISADGKMARIDRRTGKLKAPARKADRKDVFQCDVCKELDCTGCK